MKRRRGRPRRRGTARTLHDRAARLHAGDCFGPTSVMLATRKCRPVSYRMRPRSERTGPSRSSCGGLTWKAWTPGSELIEGRSYGPEVWAGSASPEAVAFAGHYDFDIDVLSAYRPQSKDRVERQVNIVRDHVLAGRAFSSIEELNATSPPGSHFGGRRPTAPTAKSSSTGPCATTWPCVRCRRPRMWSLLAVPRGPSAEASASWMRRTGTAFPPAPAAASPPATLCPRPATARQSGPRADRCRLC